MMDDSALHFDTYLDVINAPEVKAMARLWGGRTGMSKPDAAKIVVDGLKDPYKAKAAVEALPVWERNALAILRYMGGTANYQTLGLGLIAAGANLPTNSKNMPLDAKELVSRLFKRGLVLSNYQYNPGYFSEYSSNIIWSDLRLLQAAGYVHLAPLTLPTLGVPEHTSFRRPAVVALDLLGVLQAVDQMGGLQLTKTGLIRATDIKKLRKTLRWPETGVSMDGFTMPDPTEAWVHALARSGLMRGKDDRLVLSEPLMTFADRPVSEQVRILLYGLVRSASWLEIPEPTRWFDQNGTNRMAGRLMLALGLGALPLDGRPFFSVDDFDQALYDRAGEHFSLDGNATRPYYLRYEDEDKQEVKWRAQRRAAWLKLERIWLEAALQSWLYFLGVVELASDGERVMGMRLTELGCDVFHPSLTPPSSVSAAPESAGLQPGLQSANGEATWVVQPNFDVIVYLEQATPAQLAFLERHGERQQAHQHTAHYLLTRQSVYRGLESGSTLAGLLEGLRAGSTTELPQNVVVELTEWAGLRERMTCFRRASLLEFDSEKARQRAMRDGPLGKKGLKGIAVGERFLLLTDPTQTSHPPQGIIRINYSMALPKCLTVSEDGLMQIKSKSHDLLIEAQIKPWVEPAPDGHWRLTANSVRASLASKRKVDQLFRLLQERLSHDMPKLLRLALISWGDSARKVELSQVTVLRSADSFVFEALVSSSKIRACFKGVIFPDILLVDTTQMEALREQLAWLELEISPDLTIQPGSLARFGYR
jgi:hypothetical protein